MAAAAASGFVTSFSANVCDVHSDAKSDFDFCGNRLCFRNSVACFPTRTVKSSKNLSCKISAPERQPFILNPRCEVAGNAEVQSPSSSLSALELLKASAASRYTKESSSIVVIGLNYRTAPIEIREKLSIPEAQWPQAINELCALNHIEEAAVLSTCNRMEIYVVALSRHRGVKEVTEWMSKVLK